MANKYNIVVGSILLHKKTAHPIIITELYENNNREYISFRSLKDGNLSAKAIDIENLISEIKDNTFEVYAFTDLEIVKSLYG